MTDLVDQIEQVHRELRDRGATTAVILSRTYDTTVEDLWETCTTAERLARWFEPVDGDLHEGGRYRLRDSGTAGTVEHCAPPTRLRVTWEYGGNTSHVELTLAERDGRAELRLEHVVGRDAHWDEFGPGAAGIGWDISLLALALHLAGDGRAEPAAMERFTTSDEGAALFRRAGDGWARAHAASGADPDVARAAVERTLAFYAGSAQPG
jgi:uncharacterized protein YndB with AHSA1/START domain